MPNEQVKRVRNSIRVEHFHNNSVTTSNPLVPSIIPISDKGPGDRVLEVRDRAVALTDGEYQGTRRMTFTYRPLNAARKILFLVTGKGKEDALKKLIAQDPEIPAGRIDNSNMLTVTDLSPESLS